MSSITLHYFPPSAPSRIALLVARAVGVQVEIRVVDLWKKEQLNPEFVKLNPQHTVPTLQDGDFVLSDSHVIASYLVQTYGTDDKLYPRNPQHKALVDQRLYFDCLLYDRLRRLCIPVMYLGETTFSESEKQSLDEALGWMDIFLTGRPWLAGTHMTIADFACSVSLSNIIAINFDISKHKKISEWFARCKKEIPGFEENLVGAEQFGKAIKSKLIMPNEI